MWTKGDIYEAFNVSFEGPQYGSSRQAWANFWLLRVNTKTRELISKWENLASNFHLISDEESKAPNDPTFVENRHDQSLLSMLLKASMIRIVEPEQAAEQPEKEARALVEYEQAFHPRFGVRDLSAIQGELHNLITRPISGRSSSVDSAPSPAERWMCIGDACHDLTVQPQGSVPRGVGHAV